MCADLGHIKFDLAAAGSVQHLALHVRVMCQASGQFIDVPVGGSHPVEDAYALMRSARGPAAFIVRWFFGGEAAVDDATAWYDGLPPALPAALRLRWAAHTLAAAYRAAQRKVKEVGGPLPADSFLKAYRQAEQTIMMLYLQDYSGRSPAQDAVLAALRAGECFPRAPYKRDGFTEHLWLDAVVAALLGADREDVVSAILKQAGWRCDVGIWYVPTVGEDEAS